MNNTRLGGYTSSLVGSTRQPRSCRPAAG